MAWLSECPQRLTRLTVTAGHQLGAHLGCWWGHLHTASPARWSQGSHVSYVIIGFPRISKRSIRSCLGIPHSLCLFGLFGRRVRSAALDWLYGSHQDWLRCRWRGPRTHLLMGRIPKNSCFKTTTIVMWKRHFSGGAWSARFMWLLGNPLQRRLRAHLNMTGVWTHTKKSLLHSAVSPVSVTIIQVMVSYTCHLTLAFLSAFFGTKT